MRPASEDDILGIVGRFFPVSHPSLLLGRGDDCAVLRPGAPLAVTTDIFAEDAHFRRRYFSPFDIGYKAVETIVKILNGEEYGDVDTGTEIITKDNAQARLDNFANWLK